MTTFLRVHSADPSPVQLGDPSKGANPKSRYRGRLPAIQTTGS